MLTMIPNYYTALDAMFDMDSFGRGRRVNQSDNDSQNFVVRAEAQVNNRDDGYDIEVYMPGVSRSDIQVYTEDRTLRVSGNRKTQNGNQQYSRSWSLSETVDSSNISARYDSGILYLSVNSRKPVRRNIDIE